MSVRQAQREIDSAEFTEWMAFQRLEPYGPERADMRAGIVASTIANVHAGGKRKAYTPADFMPKFDRRVKKQTMAEMKANWMAFVAARTPRGKA